MASTQRGELGARKAAVLRAVIEEYIRTGEPVGSETVVERYRLDVSPATIRNEMAALEELGYLSHPHTSAGRLPTDLGYRHFVDSLPQRSALRDAHRRAIARFFEQAAQDLEEVLVGATRLLSHVTQHAGLAVSASPTEERILQAELLEIGSSLLLLVVGQHGRVSKAVLPRPENIGASALSDVARTVRGLSDLSLDAAAERVRATARGAARDRRPLLAAAAAALADLHESRESERVLVEGVGNLAAELTTWRQTTVRVLFDALERETEVLRLVHETSPAGDVAVTIGTEHPVTGSWDAAVVAAPYLVAGTPVGTIGVVGPTRMDYLTAVSAVRAVSRRLSELATALERPWS
jgi:heat-inducible transcriptional repressor